MTLTKHVADAVIRLKADRTGLNKDMATTKKDMKKRAEDMGMAFAKILGVTAVVGGVVHSMKAIAEETARTGDQFQKMSQMIGVSVENLSALAHAAKIGGTDLNTVATGLRLLQKRALDADNGLAEAKRTFDRLGISVRDGNGKMKDAHQLLLEMSEAFKNVTSSTERTALAQEAFGRSGATLIPLLTSDVKALEEEARKLGVTWSQDDANAAADLTDNMTRLKAQFTAMKEQGAKELIPMLNDMLKSFLEVKNAVDDFNSSMDEIIRNVSGGSIGLGDLIRFNPLLRFNPVVGGFKNLLSVLRSLGVVKGEVKESADIIGESWRKVMENSADEKFTRDSEWLADAVKKAKPPTVELTEKVAELYHYITNLEGKFNPDYFVGPMVPGGGTTDQIGESSVKSLMDLEQEHETMKQEWALAEQGRGAQIMMMLEAENDLIRQQIDLKEKEHEKEVQLTQQKLQGSAMIAGALANVLETNAGNNVEMLKFLKILRMGEIMLNMAGAVSQSANTPPPANLIFIAQMVALTGQLISQIKSVKSPPKPEIKVPSFAVEATVMRPTVAQVGDRPGGEYVVGVERLDRQISDLRKEIRDNKRIEPARVIFDKQELIRGLAIEFRRIEERENLH